MPFGSEGVAPGVGLALSGGGFRATLFHIGGLWRLNELGFLPRLSRISSVSGGSITSGVLALHWRELAFQQGVATNFVETLVTPLRTFCERSVDVWAIGEGAFLPWKTVSDAVREEYETHLFGAATLQDLPDTPRFVFNTTNFQTGIDFRFSKPYAGDYRLGLIPEPTFTLALAVTASSAFPPFLSPVVVDVDPTAFERTAGADLYDHVDYRRTLYLTDGGVYDNLGLETVWNRYDTVLVSDAGKPLDVPAEVATSWKDQALRAMDIATNQVRSLRKRALLDDLVRGVRKGTYWGITTNIGDYRIADYAVGGPLACDPATTSGLASIRTRLNPFSEAEQCQLINWGYALCDAAMRQFILPQNIAVPQPAWPYKAYSLA
jgi:NTE family protein